MQFRACGIDRMSQLVDGRIDTPTEMFPAVLTSFLELLHEAIDVVAFLLLAVVFGIAVTVAVNTLLLPTVCVMGAATSVTVNGAPWVRT